MKWETPEAIDLRYGMEITMYIAIADRPSLLMASARDERAPPSRS